MRKVHLIGVKGQAMSVLAGLFAKKGFQVSGSDVKETFPSDEALKALKIKVRPFSARNIADDLDFVVYSMAYSENHPERKKAAELKIPQISYAESLALFFNPRNGIAVAGSHGKTATSSLMAYMLKTAGYSPTAIIGNWQSEDLIGSSDWFVAEADEYRKKFLMLRPKYLIITNIDYDHPDIYKSGKDYLRAFRDFALNLKEEGRIIVHKRDIAKLGKIPKSLILYPQKQDEKILSESKFKLLGEHNRQNALLAIRLARFLSIKPPIIKKALSGFKGVKRRTEFYTSPSGNFVVVDDYAHHPAEIKATLKALRDNFKNYYILAVFQSHTYSRTEAFLREWAPSFKKADKVALLPIYSSAREKSMSVKKDNLNQKLYAEFKKHHRNVVFSSTFGLAEKEAKKAKKDKSPVLVATIGAGQLWKIAARLTSP